MYNFCEQESQVFNFNSDIAIDVHYPVKKQISIGKNSSESSKYEAEFNSATQSLQNKGETNGLYSFQVNNDCSTNCQTFLEDNSCYEKYQPDLIQDMNYPNANQCQDTYQVDGTQQQQYNNNYANTNNNSMNLADCMDLEVQNNQFNFQNQQQDNFQYNLDNQSNLELDVDQYFNSNKEVIPDTYFDNNMQFNQFENETEYEPSQSQTTTTKTCNQSEDDYEDEEETEEDKRQRTACKVCFKYYAKLSGLQNHVKKFHNSDKVQEFAMKPALKRGRPKGKGKKICKNYKQ